jgi:hypothetical protein
MPILEDLTVFTADFGVNATVNGLTHKVLIDKPDIDLYAEMQVSHDFNMRYITNDFPTLRDGITVDVDGVSYRINGAPMRLDDGAFSRVGLRKA